MGGDGRGPEGMGGDVRGPEGMRGALGPCTGLSALKAGLDSHSRS